MAESTSTLPAAPPFGDARVRRWAGGAIRVAFGAVVVIALTGALGVRTATTSTELADGTEVEVRYGSITRPGLATPWAVTVRRPGGFSGPIVVRTSTAYFDLFDENGLDPDPSAATQDEEMLIWEFDPPPGETFHVSLDARIEPGVHWGREATTQVEVGGDVATLTYRTWVLP